MFFCVESSPLENFVSIKVTMGDKKIVPVQFTGACEFFVAPKSWRENNVVTIKSIFLAISRGDAALKSLVRYTQALGGLSEHQVRLFFLSGLGREFDRSLLGKDKHLNYIFQHRHSFVAEALGGDGIQSGYGRYSAYFTVSRKKMGWKCSDKTYLKIIKEIQNDQPGI